MQPKIRDVKNRLPKLKYQKKYRRLNGKPIDHWTNVITPDEKIVLKLRDCKGYMSMVICPLNTHALQIHTQREFELCISAIEGLLKKF